MPLRECAVAIAGAGPTGLMLAGELALAGVDVAVVERRPTQDVEGTRARGLHPRTIEVLDQRGIADRFVSVGRPRPVVTFGREQLDIGDSPTRHNYFLGMFQGGVERLLAEWVVGDLGVPILRDRAVVGVEQDDAGVHLGLSAGGPVRARYVVGCDGGRSAVRAAAGIEFPGWGPTSSQLIAEVETAVDPELGPHPGGGDIFPVDRDRTGGPYRVVVVEQDLEHRGEPSLDDVKAALVGAYGTDFGVHSPTWISRFTDACRQAASYRQGRVLLAGDAAHVHGPQGGQGLNVGVQDAVNLGWKLAQVVQGTSPETLLDSYHAERHPVAARVLRNTMAQVALVRADERSQALRDTTAELLAMDEPRRHVAAMVSGLDVHYDIGSGHPLVGRRMPDLDLATADGPTTAFALLHPARPVLLRFTGAGDLDLSPWAHRVRVVEAEATGPWELPVIGRVAPCQAVAIRPDGHVAWAGDLLDPELPRALTRWFGAP